MRKAKTMVLFFVFYCMYLNFNPLNLVDNEDEGQIAYAQEPTPGPERKSIFDRVVGTLNPFADDEPETPPTPIPEVLPAPVLAAPPTAPAQPEQSVAAPPAAAKKPAARPARQKVAARPAAVPLPPVDQNIPEWRMLDADLTGTNVSWREAWRPQFAEAASAMQRAGKLACLRVHAVEDIEVYQPKKVERYNCITDDMATCRAGMTKERGDRAEAELMNLQIPAEQIKRGNPYTKAPLGQRGVILRLIENCIAPPPEPAQTAVSCWDDNGNGDCDEDEKGDDGICDAKDCQGSPGRSDINIDWDIALQYLLSYDRDDFTGLMLRANWPVSENWTIGLGAEYGVAGDYTATGFELGAEYNWSRLFKPRFMLVGRAYNLDYHLYYGRGEIGGGTGFVGELYKSENWSFIYEVRGEVKGDTETKRRDWQTVYSGTGNLGARF